MDNLGYALVGWCLGQLVYILGVIFFDVAKGWWWDWKHRKDYR